MSCENKQTTQYTYGTAVLKRVATPSVPRLNGVKYQLHFSAYYKGIPLYASTYYTSNGKMRSGPMFVKHYPRCNTFLTPLADDWFYHDCALVENDVVIPTNFLPMSTKTVSSEIAVQYRPSIAAKKNISPIAAVVKPEITHFKGLAKQIKCPIYCITKEKRRRIKSIKVLSLREKIVNMRPNSVSSDFIFEFLKSDAVLGQFFKNMPHERRNAFLLQLSMCLTVTVSLLWILRTTPSKVKYIALAANLVQLLSFFSEYASACGIPNLAGVCYESIVDDLIPCIRKTLGSWFQDPIPSPQALLHEFNGHLVTPSQLPGSANNLEKRIINEIVDKYVNLKPNSFDMSSIIKLVTCIMTVGLISITLTGTSVSKTFAALAKNLRDAKTVSDSFKNFSGDITSLLGDLIHGQQNHTIVQLEALISRAQILNTMPVLELWQNSLMGELTALPDRISQAITSIPKTEAADLNMRTISQLLVSAHSTAVQRLQDLKTISTLQTRPDPRPILFAGEKAVGKSHLCDSLRKELAAILKYSNSNWYQLAKPPQTKHHLTYFGEQISYVEEFALTEDCNVYKNFNTIFSPNPYIIAGAALSEKRQMFTSSIVLMNTNKDKHDFWKQHSKTGEAMMSRIVWFNCEDPNIGDNPRQREIVHRRADYSHLKITYMPAKGANDVDRAKMRVVSYADLKSILSKAAAQSESAFLERLLTDPTLKLAQTEIDSFTQRKKFLDDLFRSPGLSLEEMNRDPSNSNSSTSVVTVDLIETEAPVIPVSSTTQLKDVKVVLPPDVSVAEIEKQLDQLTVQFSSLKEDNQVEESPVQLVESLFAVPSISDWETDVFITPKVASSSETSVKEAVAVSSINLRPDVPAAAITRTFGRKNKKTKVKKQTEILPSLEIVKASLEIDTTNLRPNSLVQHRHFPVFRFQGKAGTGKSTFMNSFGAKLSSIFGFPLIHPKLTDPEKEIKDPSIIVLDDLHEHKHQEQFVEFMNRTHPKSIFLLGTNFVVNYEVSWSQWVLDKIPFPVPDIVKTRLSRGEYARLQDSDDEGYVRRAGLPKSYLLGGKWNTAVSPFSVTIDTDTPLWKVITPTGTKNLTCPEIQNYLYSVICSYYKAGLTTPVREYSPPTFEPDIYLRSSSVDNILKITQSPIDKLRLLNGSTIHGTSAKCTKIAVDTLIKTLDMKTFTIPPEGVTKENYRDLAIALGQKILLASPNINIMVHTPEFSICTYNGHIYCPTDIRQWTVHFSGNFQTDRRIWLTDGIDSIQTCLRDVQAILISDVDEIIKYGYSMDQIGSIRTAFLDGLTIKPQYTRLFARAAAERSETFNIWKYTLISAASFTSLLGIIYGVYKFMTVSTEFQNNFFTPNHKGTRNSNRMDDDSYIEYSKYLEAFKGNDENMKELYRQKVVSGDLTKGEGIARADLWANTKAESEELCGLLHAKFINGLENPKYMANLLAAHSDSTFLQFLCEKYNYRLKPNSVTNVTPVTPANKNYEFLTAKVQKALAVYSSSYDHRVSKNYALFIGGHYALTVAHPISEDNHQQHTLTFDYEGKSKTCLAQVVYINRAKDQAVLKILDNRIPAFPDIVKYFYDGEINTEVLDCIYARPVGGMMEIFSGRSLYHKRTHVNLSIPSENFYLEKELLEFTVPNLAARQVSQPGDCGIPILGQVDGRYHILGIHCALGDHINMFTCVQQSILHDLMPIRPNSTTDVEVCGTFGKLAFMSKELKSLFEETSVDGYWTPGVESRGSSKDAFCYDSNHKKPYKICMSDLKTLPRTSALAPLREENVMKPGKLYKNLLTGKPSIFFTQMMKFGQDNGFNPDMQLFLFTREYLLWYYEKFYGKVRMLTNGEAINGVQNPKDELYDASNGLMMDTSAGIVFHKKFNATIKGQVLKNTSPSQVPYYEIDTSIPAGRYLKENIARAESYYKAGEYYLLGAKACLKPEVLPIDKCEEGGTRLFQACDLDSIIIGKKIFGSLMSKQTLKRHEAVSQVGINPYIEMTHRIERLSQIKGKIHCYDYKRFDKSIRMELLEQYADMRFQILPEKDKTIENYNLIRNYTISAVHSVQVYQGSVFIVGRGNLSGCPDTGIKNDYVNHFALVYTIAKHMKMHIPHMLDIMDNEEFSTCYDAVTLGDDIAFTTVAPVEFDFMKTAVAELGFELTTSSKGLYDEETFLSRTISMSPDGLVYPKLKKSSIERLLYFTISMEPALLAVNFDNCLKEAALWDRDYYELIRKALAERLDTFPLNLRRKISERIVYFKYEIIRTQWAKYIRGHGRVPDFMPPADKASEIKFSSNSFTYKRNLSRISLKKIIRIMTYNGKSTVFEYVQAYPIRLSGEIESIVRQIDDLGPPPTTALKKDIEAFKVHLRKTVTTAESSTQNFLAKPDVDSFLHGEFDVVKALQQAQENVSVLIADLQIKLKDLQFEERSLGLKPNTLTEPAQGTSMEPGTKMQTPVIPAVPGESGNTSGAPPARDSTASSSTVAGPLTSLNDPNIRASRDMPAQAPLMDMVGGPPDMSFMNMYQDDLLNLVYRQFEHSTVTVQGGQAKGAIVMRLPYGLNLLNPYAQFWARAHKRYNGRIQVTFSVSAVPLMVGNVIIGVVRNMPPKDQSTIDISSLQKINWAVINLNGSGDYTVSVGDARQMAFFRNTSDDPAGADPFDVTERPGIIMAIYTPIVNQFPDGTSAVVFNIRSQAISPMEDPSTGFYAYEPIDQVLSVARNSSSGAIALNAICPAAFGRNLILDGTKGQIYNLANFAYQDEDLPYTSGYFLTQNQGSGDIAFNSLIPTSRSRVYWENDGNPAYLMMRTNKVFDTDAWVLGSNNTVIDEFTLTNQVFNWLNRPDDVTYLGYVTGFANQSEPLSTAAFKAQWESRDDPPLRQIYTYAYVRHHWEDVFVEVWVLKADSGLPDEGYPIAIAVERAVPIFNLGGFPSNTGGLPINCFNLKLALTSHITMSGAVNALPCYTGSIMFVSSLHNYFVNRNIISDGMRVADMIDIRTGSVFGQLGLYGPANKLTVIAACLDTTSSHFQFKLETQYIALTSPRLDTQLTPIAGSNLISLEPSLQSQLSTLQNRLQNLRPNAAAAAGMIGGGLLSGLGSGLGSWASARQQQDYFQTNQNNLFDFRNQYQKQSFENELALRAKNYEFDTALQKEYQQHQLDNKLQAQGIFAHAKIPGAMTFVPSGQNTASTSGAKTRYTQTANAIGQSTKAETVYSDNSPQSYLDGSSQTDFGSNRKNVSTNTLGEYFPKPGQSQQKVSNSVNRKTYAQAVKARAVTPFRTSRQFERRTLPSFATTPV